MENCKIETREVEKKINKVIRKFCQWVISDFEFGFDMVTFAGVALFAVFGILLIVTWPAATGMII